MTKLVNLLSWRNWGIVRYNSIWQNLAGLFYIALAGRLFSPDWIGRVGLFVLFSTCMTGYGYLVNDLADMELDRLHGKPNALGGMSRSRATLVTLATLLLGAACASPFVSRPWFALPWLLWILMATAYSLRPLRLKERGLAGLMATIAAQQTLPTILLFAAFGALASWGALVFILYSTARGISSDVGHQMRDWARDANTGTGTFAVRHGYSTIQRLYAVSLEAERLALGGVVLLLLWGLPLARGPVSPALPSALLYVPLYTATAGRSWRALRQNRLEADDPYDEARQSRRYDSLQIIHHTLPSVLIPTYLAVWLTVEYWPNVIFVFVLGLLYGPFFVRRWTSRKLPARWIQR